MCSLNPPSPAADDEETSHASPATPPPEEAPGMDADRGTYADRGPMKWLAMGLIALVRGYQMVLSPLLGNVCRFHPSCSRYYILAVRKYGAISGSWRGLRRISRCHPWNPGGHDPP